MSIKISRLKEVLSGFKDVNVAVLGDLILDQFIWGDVTRISPEAPVPVVHVQRESVMPGGAANVSVNISALSGSSAIFGVIGEDIWGRMLKNILKKNKNNISGILADKERKTSLKTRVVARQQQVVRVDREVIKEISREMSDKIVAQFSKQLSGIRAVIIEDYGKGVINPYLLKQIMALAKKKKLIVTVDPKEDHFDYYRGATCITPNIHEAGKAAGIAITDKEALYQAGKKLLQKYDLCAVLITLGENGMCLFEGKKAPIHIPTRALEVFDVSGAGDTVIAAFTQSLACGASFEEAAQISNYAAGVVVGKLGVACCSQKELIARVEKDAAEKNLSLSDNERRSSGRCLFQE